LFLARLCGSGKHAPIAGHNIHFRVNAFYGFNFEATVSTMPVRLFNQLIAAPQLEGYYKTVHNTYYERRNCRDQDSSCPALKSACHDPVVKTSCPVTCGTCAQFEEVSEITFLLSSDSELQNI